MKPTPPISAAEWEVMKIVWREGPCTAQVVVESLASAQHWHPSTIKTLITRLVQKGALNYKKNGRGYLYSAAVSQRESRHAETMSFLTRVFDGSLTPLLAHFAEHGRKLRAEDFAELEKILQKSRPPR